MGHSVYVKYFVLKFVVQYMTHSVYIYIYIHIHIYTQGVT